MNKILVLSLLTLLSVSTVWSIPGGGRNSGGSTDLGNGEGLAEKHIHEAFSKVFFDISDYLTSPQRASAPKESEILTCIVNNADRERESQIKFKKSSAKGSVFRISGIEKIAVTGDYVGSDIVFNLDQIYTTDNHTREKKAISVIEAESILVHELGHHCGEKDERFLDSLGLVISDFLKNKTTASVCEPLVKDTNYSKLIYAAYAINCFNKDGSTQIKFNPIAETVSVKTNSFFTKIFTVKNIDAFKVSDSKVSLLIVAETAKEDSTFDYSGKTMLMSQDLSLDLFGKKNSGSKTFIASHHTTIENVQSQSVSSELACTLTKVR